MIVCRCRGKKQKKGLVLIMWEGRGGICLAFICILGGKVW